METAQIDANEISQHPEIIKGAQKEIIKQDVLVCGGCHAVFHFIEDFSSHKEKSCSEESHLKDCREVKAKVWAFLLWKGAQVGYDSTSINSWQLYQEWIKMDSELRETWIVAGKNVQTFAKMGHGGVQELPNKSNKINSNLNDKKQGLKGSKNALVNDLAMRGIEVKTLQTNNKKDEDKDWSAESEVESDEDKSSKSVNTRKESDKENKVSTTVPNLPAVEIKTIKKDSIGDLKDSNMRLALRTCKANDADRGLPTGEYTVEKILAKRFNPRRKQHEYLLKWEGYSQ
ncbi:uncharacterized protein LOC113367413 [Ctenocephalides felis]|uniref:uncharacterized protein LOC113367413 n=1 Tax=Ctenocephalides felis TaxID=7515 RepID=UPI000E6E2053|nr:uncharacterized protein LOC113367413 [Ctenocephalides felis]